MKYCYNCGKAGTEEHHAFFGTGNRELSDQYKLIFDLCPDCHRGQPNGVHGGNRKLDLELKKAAQWHFQKMYPKLDFLLIFGRNYL